jgi:hypothetical protein
VSDPVRLAERSESELESALLAAGASYRTSAQARARTLAALGIAGSATAVASTTTAATLTKATWIKLIATVSVVTTVAVVPVGYYVSHRNARVVAADTTARRMGVTAAVPIPAPVGPADIAPSTALPDRAAARSASHVRPMKVGARRTNDNARASDATLAQELVALDAVRASLARGDAADALSLLNTYHRAYPRGDLKAEAEVLLIDALAETGRTDLARARAEKFLRLHPDSVLGPRVRKYAGK